MSLSRFDFVIVYRPRKQPGFLDALSRGSNFMPKKGEAAYDQYRTMLLKLDRLGFQTIRASLPFYSSFLDKVHTTLAQDPLALDIKQQLTNDSNDSSDFKI